VRVKARHIGLEVTTPVACPVTLNQLLDRWTSIGGSRLRQRHVGNIYRQLLLSYGRHEVARVHEQLSYL